MRWIPVPRGLTGSVSSPDVVISAPAGVADFQGFAPELPKRQTVLEGGFSSTYKTDFDWTFDADRAFNSTTMEQSFTSLNGFDAISVTWKGNPSHNPPQATHGDRWGADIRLPLLPGFEDGYDRGWLSQDMKLVSPFSSPKGVKIVGQKADDFPFNDSETGVGDAGFLDRFMLGANGTDQTGDRKARSRLHFVDNVTLIHWDAQANVVALDKVVRTEQEFLMNSASGLSDGFIKHRYDEGTATAHASPQTIRAQNLNMRMYFDGEANRNSAKVKFIRYQVIFGGNNSTWWPTTDTEIILGRVAFEIPA